jgi:hypothetical protein
MQKIMDACLLVFDTLRDDKESEDIIILIGEAEGDDDIKEGLILAIKRLEIVNPSVAKVVRDKTQGFI